MDASHEDVTAEEAKAARPYGLASYALKYTGYQLFEELIGTMLRVPGGVGPASRDADVNAS